MPDAVDLGFVAGLPPRRAIEHLERKGYAVSWNWWEVWEGAHDKAFTVAKATRRNVLESIRGALDDALKKGTTRREFIRELEPTLRRLGWWGRRVDVAPDGGAEVVQLGSPYRLRTIYDTNMRVAFNASRQRHQRANLESRPYWQYQSRQDSHTRPEHAALHGAVFRADDPIWRALYPPNGFNCRCRIRALTERQVRAKGLHVRDSAGHLHEVMQKVGVDKRTGEEIMRPGTAYSWTEGGKRHTLLPDPGWSYGPGRDSFIPPPAAAPPPRTVLAGDGPSARRAVEDAAATARGRRDDARRRLERLKRRIADPGIRTGRPDYDARRDLEQEVDALERQTGAAGRRVFERLEEAAWGSGSLRWTETGLEQRYGPALGSWLRMIRPDLVRRLRAPTIDRSRGGSYARYWSEYVAMRDDAGPEIMVHELAHLLEADDETWRAALGFLRRRTVGDQITIDQQGREVLRDKWRDLMGREYTYPGRIYRVGLVEPGVHTGTVRVAGAPPSFPGAMGGGGEDVRVFATETLSMGMQWMYDDPAGFAREDPEYFDFIWDTLIRDR